MKIKRQKGNKDYFFFEMNFIQNPKLEAYQLAFTCLMSTIETLERAVKYVQS